MCRIKGGQERRKKDVKTEKTVVCVCMYMHVCVGVYVYFSVYL